MLVTGIEAYNPNCHLRQFITSKDSRSGNKDLGAGKE